MTYQALCICGEMFAAPLIHMLLLFYPFPNFFEIFAHFGWICIHGQSIFIKGPVHQENHFFRNQCSLQFLIRTSFLIIIVWVEKIVFIDKNGQKNNDWAQFRAQGKIFLGLAGIEPATSGAKGENTSTAPQGLVSKQASKINILQLLF